QVPEHVFAQSFAPYKLMLVWQGDSYQWYKSNEVEQQGTFTLDPGASPKRLEKKPAPGETGSPQKGIYEINGDTLRMCLSNGPDYPTAFGSDAGGLMQTMELKRVAKLGALDAPILGTKTPLRVEDLARDMADDKRFAPYRRKIL